MDNKTILKGAFKALLLIILVAANYLLGGYLFGFMSVASTSRNIMGLIGMFCLIVADIISLNTLVKTHTKCEAKSPSSSEA